MGLLELYFKIVKLPELDGVSGEVQDILVERIERGHHLVEIEDIAYALGMTKRTLQRRLNHEQEVFKEIRELVRLNFAVRLLAEEHLKIDEVADRVGYKDRTTVTQSFKRHLGASPRDVQKAVKGIY